MRLPAGMRANCRFALKLPIRAKEFLRSLARQSRLCKKIPPICAECRFERRSNCRLNYWLNCRLNYRLNCRLNCAARKNSGKSSAAEFSHESCGVSKRTGPAEKRAGLIGLRAPTRLRAAAKFKLRLRVLCRICACGFAAFWYFRPALQEARPHLGAGLPQARSSFLFRVRLFFRCPAHPHLSVAARLPARRQSFGARYFFICSLSSA